MRVIDEVRKRIASVILGLSDKVIFKQISGGKYSKQRGQPVSTKALWGGACLASIGLAKEAGMVRGK